MPMKATVHLHFPTHDKEIVVKKPLLLDGHGRYRDEKAQIDVPLMPGMNHHAGTVKLAADTMKLLARDLQNTKADASEIIHIDVDGGGVQMKYAGLQKGWVGIPGAYTYKAQTDKDAQELYEGRKPQEKHTILVILVVGMILSMVGNIIMASMALG